MLAIIKRRWLGLKFKSFVWYISIKHALNNYYFSTYSQNKIKLVISVSCWFAVFFNVDKIVSLGVSICLDRVVSRSRRRQRVRLNSRENLILTASKSASRQSRNLGRDRDFSISSRHQCPDQKVSIEIEKLVKIWKFWRFYTVCLDLDQEVHGFLYFLINISQSVETFHHFQT